MTNNYNNVYYIGVSSGLYSRILEHKNKRYEKAFTSKYNCKKLVYYKFFSTIEEAIGEEKRLKKWNRDWKIKLITDFNPNWIDLFSCDI